MDGPFLTSARYDPFEFAQPRNPVINTPIVNDREASESTTALRRLALDSREQIPLPELPISRYSLEEDPEPRHDLPLGPLPSLGFGNKSRAIPETPLRDDEGYITVYFPLSEREETLSAGFERRRRMLNNRYSGSESSGSPPSGNSFRRGNTVKGQNQLTGSELSRKDSQYPSTSGNPGNLGSLFVDSQRALHDIASTTQLNADTTNHGVTDNDLQSIYSKPSTNENNPFASAHRRGNIVKRPEPAPPVPPKDKYSGQPASILQTPSRSSSQGTGISQTQPLARFAQGKSRASSTDGTCAHGSPNLFHASNTVAENTFSSREVGNLAEDSEISLDYFINPTKIRRSPKQLFGERGILGPGVNPNDFSPKKQTGIRKLLNIGSRKVKERSPTPAQKEELIQKIATILSDADKRLGPVDSKVPTFSSLAISIRPHEQMKMLGELEFMLSETANTFLLQEMAAKHLSGMSIGVAKAKWAKKNRPSVAEFRFDFTTQYELAKANQFMAHFRSGAFSNHEHIKTMLQSWKRLAQEFKVRTFCLPDINLRKIVTKAYELFQFLGAPMDCYATLRHIAQILVRDIANTQRMVTEKSKHHAIPYAEMALKELEESPGGSDEDLYPWIAYQEE